MLITPDEDGRLNTTVYRMPTHTDQYLHWDSHHAITSKYSVIGTLYHRARTICSNPSQLQKEENIYSNPYVNISKLDTQQSQVEEAVTSPEEKPRKCQQSEPSNIRAPKPYIVVPYHQGLSESLKRTCKKYGIEVHPKGGHTIKDLLMAPKDKDPILKKVE